MSMRSSAIRSWSSSRASGWRSSAFDNVDIHVGDGSGGLARRRAVRRDRRRCRGTARAGGAARAARDRRPARHAGRRRPRRAATRAAEAQRRRQLAGGRPRRRDVRSAGRFARLAGAPPRVSGAPGAQREKSTRRRRRPHSALKPRLPTLTTPTPMQSDAGSSGAIRSRETITMNATHLFKLSIVAVAFAAAAGGAAAQSQAPTRADMHAAVVQARARGELVPAGEAVQPFASMATGSARSRADVRNEVLQARAEGELIPAGQGMTFDAPTAPSLLARAEVQGVRSPGAAARRADPRRRRDGPRRVAGTRLPRAQRFVRGESPALIRGGRGRAGGRSSRQTPCPRQRRRGRVEGSPERPSSLRAAHERHSPTPAVFLRPCRHDARCTGCARTGDDASTRQRLRRERHLRRPPAEVDPAVQRRRQGNAADQLHRRAEGDPDLRGGQRRQERRRRHGARRPAPSTPTSCPSPTS